MIPMQYALRRRMMGSNTRKWTLEVEPSGTFASVSIDENKLEAGTYVVDDGTIVHFKANGVASFIKVNGENVAFGAYGIPAKYDLELHSNCTAISGMSSMSGTWTITTQQ